MWPLYYHHILALIQARLKGYYNNAINMRISLDGYGSKIRKVSECRLAVSNKTILTTKQEFFFTKVAPVQSITDIVLWSFWLILLPWVFISSYASIFFFVKNFFSNIYISPNTIFESSSLGSLVGEWNGVKPNCVQVRTGEGGLKNRS